MKYFKFLIINFAAAFCLFSCIGEQFSYNPNDKLAFSADTLKFDTLFSTIPSYTQEVMIYNRNDKALNIRRIELSGGINSVFRFNLDGYPSKNGALDNIIIGAKDSLFLLVETTLNLNDSTLPVYISENLIFTLNNQQQKLVVEAYSQDANIFRRKTLTQNTTFIAEKPYLIFDYLHVAAGKTLTLEAGTRIFMHKNAEIIVDGNIISNGTVNQQVVIRGDRFDLAYIDVPYDYMPAQWGGITLQNEAGENRFTHTVIRSGTSGITFMGGSQFNTKLVLENCVIHNMNDYGILSQNADIEIINTEISNCGKSCVFLLGGKLKMAHSTIANYLELGAGNSQEAVYLQNFILDGRIVYPFPISSVVVENSIIFGKTNNEVRLRDTTDIMFNVLISNSLIKGKKSERLEFQNIIWSYSQNENTKTDTVFMNIPKITETKKKGYYNFQLAENSRAKDKANTYVSALYPTDFFSKNRFSDGKPDLGAYEKFEE
ncbi:MAG: hypothetical protein LBS50_07280 [Prevotellaceae bacterium]|jgi:hypothetical protein|nr:hypothetical protein [Prevotellaceae bacterium]